MPITNIPYAYTLDTRHDNPPWHMAGKKTVERLHELFDALT